MHIVKFGQRLALWCMIGVSKSGFAVAVLMVLALSFSASAQRPLPVGWVFSRANCINNESITWLMAPAGRRFLPKGVPALRRTASTHYDRLNDVSHTVTTGDNLELTSRSAAIHWFEGRPTYLGTRWVTRLVPVWRLVLTDDGWKIVCVLRPVRVRVRVYMTDRWVVSGDHWENAGAGITHRRTSATDCNWEGTFNS